MARISPFKGLRFNTEKAGSIETLVCPPYDIISENERKALISANSCNMVGLELPVGEDKYSQAGKLYRQWLADGVLRSDDKDTIYIYEEQFEAYGHVRKIKGIISRVFLEAFSKGVVLPHEETLSKAKADRFELMCATGCNFSQIYSLYDDADGSVFSRINTLSEGRPAVCLKTDDGIVHRLWTVTDTDDIDYFEKKFADKQLFIADGHHRYETALNYREKLSADGLVKNDDDDGNFVMMMLVDLQNDGLVVFPTHRLIKGLSEFNPDSLLKDISKDFDIKKLDIGEDYASVLSGYTDSKAFVLYMKKSPYLVTLHDMKSVARALPDKCDAYRVLDVAVLHSCILEPVLGIDKANMANQTNLTYTRDISEAINGVDRGDYQCAFILNPTKVSEIRDVALANEKMPQKSTYFYPKILTGLVINKII